MLGVNCHGRSEIRVRIEPAMHFLPRRNPIPQPYSSRIADETIFILANANRKFYTLPYMLGIREFDFPQGVDFVRLMIILIIRLETGRFPNGESA